MDYKVTSPVTDFVGRVAGVDFVGGEGHTSDENALAYFRRHGYTVTKPKAKARKKTELHTPTFPDGG